MGSIDILICVLCVFTLLLVGEYVCVWATGCSCDLVLDDIVTEDGDTVAIYNGKKVDIDLQVVRLYVTGEIAQSISVTVDRLGNMYTDKQYTLLIVKLVSCSTLFILSVLFKIYMLL